MLSFDGIYYETNSLCLLVKSVWTNSPDLSAVPLGSSPNLWSFTSEYQWSTTSLGFACGKVAIIGIKSNFSNNHVTRLIYHSLLRLLSYYTINCVYLFISISFHHEVGERNSVISAPTLVTKGSIWLKRHGCFEGSSDQSTRFPHFLKKKLSWEPC